MTLGTMLTTQNEVFLAASPIRPVSTILPVTLLQKTVPIYSRAFFKDQFQPTKSVVKGWTYITTGIYWCDKAFDKGAKGGKVWSIDMDDWRERGRAGQGWGVDLKELQEDSKPIEEEDGSEDEEEGSDADIEDVEAKDDVEDEDVEAGKTSTPRKRKAKTVGVVKGKKKRRIATTTKSGSVATPSKGRRKAHPKSSTSNLPATIAPEDLPTDPYQRALRLLHVGATPDSLPCREEEFVDVLSRVEEGVEGGGGGCLCGSVFLADRRLADWQISLEFQGQARPQLSTLSSRS